MACAARREPDDAKISDEVVSLDKVFAIQVERLLIRDSGMLVLCLDAVVFSLYSCASAAVAELLSFRTGAMSVGAIWCLL